MSRAVDARKRYDSGSDSFYSDQPPDPDRLPDFTHTPDPNHLKRYKDGAHDENSTVPESQVDGFAS